uniref:C12orf31 homolog n=1 Tax=Caligus clemensi TaxID=344056 RepID=C1C0C9_CALCM|nr:C12orf31 homolog [Caligus clemensi]
MAKSLRSKWKRKMRAEKRIRYGVKEKAKLVKMVESYAQEKASQEETVMATSDAPASNPDVIPLSTQGEKMETSGDGPKRSAGPFPIWMSQRRIKKMKETAKRRKNPILAANGGTKGVKKVQKKMTRKRR